MTTEQEGKMITNIGHKYKFVKDEEEDSDPDVDMVSVFPSLWFY